MEVANLTCNLYGPLFIYFSIFFFKITSKNNWKFIITSIRLLLRNINIKITKGNFFDKIKKCN